MAEPSLLELYAGRVGLPPERARRRFFYACLPWWKRPLVKVARRLFPRAFHVDWALVEDAGRCRTFAAVEHAVDIFRYRTRGNKSVVRMRLGLRLSGTRVLKLAARCFGVPFPKPEPVLTATAS